MVETIRDSPSGPLLDFAGALSDLQIMQAVGESIEETGNTFVDMPSGASAPFPTIMQTTHLNVAIGSSLLVFFTASFEVVGAASDNSEADFKLQQNIDGAGFVNVDEGQWALFGTTDNKQEVMALEGIISTAPLVAVASSIILKLQWRRGANGASVRFNPNNGVQVTLLSGVVSAGIVRP